MLKQLTAHFSGHDLIIQLAVYPGELDAVIAGGGDARAVRATYSGKLTVGPPVSFDGTRNGIAFSQFVPGVIQHLAKLVSARGGVPPADIDRFVLTNSLPGGNSGWNIYPASGTTRFRSLVLGDRLVMITPGHARALNWDPGPLPPRAAQAGHGWGLGSGGDPGAHAGSISLGRATA